MNDDRFNGKERAALFALLAEARRVSNTELREIAGFVLDGDERRNLNALDLVRSDQPVRGRAFFHEITPAGREWCATELGSPRRTGAKTMEGALYVMLSGLGRYLDAAGLKLTDVFPPEDDGHGGSTDDQSATAAGTGTEIPGDPVEARILSAYRSLAQRPAQFVKLAVLRPQAADIPSADIDSALARMYRAQRVNLIPHSSPQLVTEEDRQAALRIGGEDKHLIAEVSR